jgi:hypothetical protein
MLASSMHDFITHHQKSVEGFIAIIAQILHRDVEATTRSFSFIRITGQFEMADTGNNK